MNGNLIFQAVQTLNQNPFYPCFSMSEIGDSVEANFGDSPFVFDVISFKNNFKAEKNLTKNKEEGNESEEREEDDLNNNVKTKNKKENKKCIIF